MLRAILLVSPVLLVVAVSCSSGDSANFSDTTPPGDDAGTSATTGGTSSTGGSNASAGNTASGGTSAGSTTTGGKGNTAGSGTTAGSGGTGSSTGGTATGGTGTGTAGKGGTAGSVGDAGAMNAGAPTGAAGEGAAGAPTGPQCVDVSGDYTIKNAEGFCNGLNKDATQSISAIADTKCGAHFVSEVQEGGQGVNGGARIEDNGGFKATMLYLNKTQRDPCTGMWDAGNERMTVKCGGAGDVCTVVLERN